MDNRRAGRTAPCGRLVILLLAVELVLALPYGADTPGGSDDVSQLLKQARWTHEPTTLIVRTVSLLDQRLDQNPKDKRAWMQLGEALAIGWASSKHAESEGEAWRKAYELDTSDCHAGALAARSSASGEAGRRVSELARAHPECPEAQYLRALASRSGSGTRTECLRKSIAIRASAEALVALGQEMAAACQWQQAERAFADALEAPTLFPEDWRPDGWAAVHAHLGLAWSYYSRGQRRAARREYEALMNWLVEPGPWHDLSETEEGWRKKLAARWPVVSGEIAK